MHEKCVLLKYAGTQKKTVTTRPEKGNVQTIKGK